MIDYLETSYTICLLKFNARFYQIFVRDRLVQYVLTRDWWCGAVGSFFSSNLYELAGLLI